MHKEIEYYLVFEEILDEMKVVALYDIYDYAVDHARQIHMRSNAEVRKIILTEHVFDEKTLDTHPTEVLWSSAAQSGAI